MKIAIVEDTDSAADILREYINRYDKEHYLESDIVRFKEAASFLFGYIPQYDCVFMDIDLPCKNGMESAKRLRERDPNVPLVFVTALSHFAREGYSVGAIDYLVKPYTYHSFELAMNAVVRKRIEAGKSLTLRNLDGTTRIPLDSIYYVEVNKHRVIYHTDLGIVDVWGSMKTARENLPEQSFVKCGASWLINLRHVRGITGDEVIVGGDRIKISRSRKKAFMNAIHAYMNRGGGNR